MSTKTYDIRISENQRALLQRATKALTAIVAKAGRSGDQEELEALTFMLSDIDDASGVPLTPSEEGINDFTL